MIQNIPINPPVKPKHIRDNCIMNYWLRHLAKRWVDPMDVRNDRPQPACKDNRPYPAGIPAHVQDVDECPNGPYSKVSPPMGHIIRWGPSLHHRSPTTDSGRAPDTQPANKWTRAKRLTKATPMSTPIVSTISVILGSLGTSWQLLPPARPTKATHTPMP